MDPRRLRRARQRRERRRRRVAGVALASASVVLLLNVTAFRTGSAARPRPAARVAPAPPPHDPASLRVVPPARPAQFLVVSFDGSGGVKLWPYWRSVARRADAHFTFFVSGVYLLDRAHSSLYHPPRPAAGASDIGFAFSEDGLEPRQVVGGMLRQIASAYREGN